MYPLRQLVALCWVEGALRPEENPARVAVESAVSKIEPHQKRYGFGLIIHFHFCGVLQSALGTAVCLFQFVFVDLRGAKVSEARCQLAKTSKA